MIGLVGALLGALFFVAGGLPFAAGASRAANEFKGAGAEAVFPDDVASGTMSSTVIDVPIQGHGSLLYVG